MSLVTSAESSNLWSLEWRQIQNQPGTEFVYYLCYNKQRTFEKWEDRRTARSATQNDLGKRPRTLTLRETVSLFSTKKQSIKRSDGKPFRLTSRKNQKIPDADLILVLNSVYRMLVAEEVHNYEGEMFRQISWKTELDASNVSAPSSREHSRKRGAAGPSKVPSQGDRPQGTGPTAGGGQSSRVSPSPVAPEKSTQARSEFYFSGSDGRLCHKEAFVIIDHTSKPTFITRDSLVARLRDDNDVVKSRELARLLKLYKERESDISKTDPWNLKKRTEKGSVGYIIKHLDTYLGDYAARNINVLSAVPKRKLKVPADPLDSQNFDYHECAFKVKSA